MDNSEKNKTEIDRSIKTLMEKIDRFLSEKNPSDVLIIKSHLICEYYLNQILILNGKSTAKEIDKLSFFDKANKAFDLQNQGQKNTHDRIVKLNQLRNRVGHELEYTLSESDVDTLGYFTGKEYVLKKYEFDKLEDLLRNTLIDIVVEVALIVINIVKLEKKNKTAVS